MPTDTPVLEVRPSWWEFFWHLVFCWLLVPLIVALIKRNSLVLRIYPDRLTLEMGWLSKKLLDIIITDYRTIEVNQSVWQRILNIGELRIDTAGNAQDELVMSGIHDPIAVRDRIQQLRRAREAAQQAVRPTE